MKKVLLFLFFVLCTLFGATAQTWNTNPFSAPKETDLPCDYSYRFIASSGSVAYSESAEKLFDGSTNTKWCASWQTNRYVTFSVDAPMKVMGYSITTANDNLRFGGRNPRNWMLLASVDSLVWDTIHVVTDEKELEDVNYTKFTFGLPQPTTKSYRFFNFVIQANHGADVIQMSEFRLIPACEYDSVLTHVDAVEASCTQFGNYEYWHNATTGLYFKNAQATEAFLGPKSVKISALPVSLIFPTDTTLYSVRVWNNTEGRYLTEEDVVSLGDRLGIGYFPKDDIHKVTPYSRELTVSESDISNCTLTIPAAVVSVLQKYVVVAPADTFGYSYEIYDRDDNRVYAGDTIIEGTNLGIYYTPWPGFTLQKDELYVEVGLGNTSNGQFIVPSPKVLMPKVYNVSVETVDSTCSLLTWSDTLHCDAYYVYIATERPTDLVYAKGIKQTADTFYTFSNLVPGELYYVYVKGVKGANETAWYERTFNAGKSSSASCMVAFHLHDSYGDGWNGCALNVYVDDELQETITFSSGHSFDYEMEIDGTFSVQWHVGSYVDETSFEMVLPSGEALTFSDLTRYSNNAVLYAGTIVCSAPVPDTLVYAYNEAGDSVHLEWTSVEGMTYELLISQGTTLTEEATPLALTDTTWSIAAVPGYLLTVGVRSVDEDGNTSKWTLTQVMPRPKDFSTSDSLISYLMTAARDIELNYLDTVKLGNCQFLGNGSVAMYVDAMRLVLTDSTEIYYHIEDNEAYVEPMVIALDAAGNENTEIEAAFYNSPVVVAPAGTYYLMLATVDLDAVCNIMLVDVNKRNPNTKPLQFDVPLYDTLTLADCYVLPGVEEVFPYAVYTTTLTDSAGIYFYVQSDENVAVAITDSNDSVYVDASIGGTVHLPAGDFRFYVVSPQPAVTKFFATKLVERTNTFVPISADTTLMLGGNNPWGRVNYEGIEVPGYAYKFTISDTTRLMLTGFCEDLNAIGFYAEVYADSLCTEYVMSEGFESYDYNSTWINTDHDSTFYMLVAADDFIEDMPAVLAIHTQTDWSNPQLYADTIRVYEETKVTIGMETPTYDYGYGSYPLPVVTKMVYLEEGKTYRFAYVSDEDNGLYPNLSLGYADTLWEYIPNRGMSRQTSDTTYDALVTIDTTGYYPLYLFVDMYDFAHHTTLNIVEAEQVEETENNAPMVSTPFATSGSFRGVKQTYWDIYDATSSINLMYNVMLYAGDTLYVDALSSEMLGLVLLNAEDDFDVIAQTDDPTMPKAGQQLSFTFGTYLDSLLVTVVMYVQNEHCFDGTYELRISKHAQDMQNTVVYPAVDKETVELPLNSTVSDVREELAKLIISAVDADDNEVAVLYNDAKVWEIDMAAGTATYELNNGDLPLGYEFSSFTEFIQVSFIFTTGIANTDADFDTQVRARKFFRDGKIYIQTPDGRIYTVMGQLVK